MAMRWMLGLALAAAAIAAPARGAVVKWVGKAPYVRQINVLTPANVEVGDVFKVTINTKTVSFTATVATVANVTAGLASALNASAEPEFTELNATDATTYLTLQHDNAGVPFTQTSSATDGGGANTQTLVTTADGTGGSQLATGPNWWSKAANWSGAAVPVNGDTVIIESGPHIRYGLDQSAVTLASLEVSRLFEAEIGQRQWNGSYKDYRDTFLKIGSTDITIGRGEGTGDGSKLIRIDTGTVQTSVNVLYVNFVGDEAQPDLEAFCWAGNHASNAMRVDFGTVGIARLAGQTSQLLTLTVNRSLVSEDSPIVRCGVDLSLGTLNTTGGNTTLRNGCTSLYCLGGRVYLHGGSIGSISTDYGPIILTRP